jgi:hypothetical protein
MLISAFSDLLMASVNSPTQVLRSLPPPSTSSATIIQSFSFASLVQLPPTPINIIDTRHKDIQVAGDWAGVGATLRAGVPFTETNRVIPMTSLESPRTQSTMIDSESVPSGTSVAITTSESGLLSQEDLSPTPTLTQDIGTASGTPFNKSVVRSITVGTILAPSQVPQPLTETASLNTSIFTSVTRDPPPLPISSSTSQMLLSSTIFTYTAPTSDSSGSALTSAVISPMDQSGGKITALHTIIGVSIGGGIALIFLVVGVLGARLRYQRIQLRVKRREELREREKET